MWIAASFMFDRVDTEHAAAFLSDVAEGAGLLAGDPAFVLRNTVMRRQPNARALAQSLKPAYQFAFVIKAWNASYAGDTVKLFRWNAAEPFPVIAGWKPRQPPA